MIADGRADLIDMIYRTPSASPHEFSAPLRRSAGGHLHHTTIGGISGVSTLKGFQIGVQSGDACIHQLATSGITTIVEYPNHTALLAQPGVRRSSCSASTSTRQLTSTRPTSRATSARPSSSTRASSGGHPQGRHGNPAARRGGIPPIRPKKTLRCAEVVRHAARHRRLRPLHRLGPDGGGGEPRCCWPPSAWRCGGRSPTKTQTLNAALAELREAHAAVSEAEQSLAATLQAIPDMLFEFDTGRHYVNVFASRTISRRRPAELIGKHLGGGRPGGATVIDAINRRPPAARTTAAWCAWPWGWWHRALVRTLRHPQTDGGGEAGCWCCRATSPSGEAERAILAAKSALVAESNRHFGPLRGGPGGPRLLPGRRIVSINQRFVELFGYRPADIPTLAEWWLQAYPDPDYRRQVRETWDAAIARAAADDGRTRASSTASPARGSPEAQHAHRRPGARRRFHRHLHRHHPDPRDRSRPEGSPEAADAANPARAPSWPT